MRVCRVSDVINVRAIPFKSGITSSFLLTGKIKIQDILACGFLDDLLEVIIIISLLHV